MKVHDPICRKVIERRRMVDGLRGLVEISHLDGEIRVRAEERAGLPARRAVCAKRKAEAEARIEAARASLEEIRQEQRRHESQVQDQGALLTRLEGQQHQVKTNEAYTALLHEMAAAREAISTAETAVLEAMEALDEAATELETAEATRDTLVAEIEAEEQGIDAREAELDGQIAALSAERASVASRIEPSLLSRYERVAGRRKPAIAIVTKEICTGCQVGVPPQRYLEICSAASLVCCDQCNRILIHQQHLD